MSKAEEACTALLKIFNDIPELYDTNYDAIGKCDLEGQDILHEIELSENQTTAGGYKLYKALRECRRTRRQCKDENELLQPLVDVLKQNENLRLKLCRVHAQIKDIARTQNERTYKPRVRDDLTICGCKNTDDESA